MDTALRTGQRCIGSVRGHEFGPTRPSPKRIAESWGAIAGVRTESKEREFDRRCVKSGARRVIILELSSRRSPPTKGRARSRFSDLGVRAPVRAPCHYERLAARIWTDFCPLRLSL